MSTDILNMTQYEVNSQAIDVALPVFAIECEVTPPLENSLDAYEEACLRLISLGLSTNSISKALNSSESLIEEILSHLELKQYAERKIGSPWKLTDDGKSYLNGNIKERASSDSHYGFMFINAIKKEILPYFYQGDIGRIPLFRGESLPIKITVQGDEEKTFTPPILNQAKLRRAYRTFFRNYNVGKDSDITEDSNDEAESFFSDLDSLDEETEEDYNLQADSEDNNDGITSNMFIRALNKKSLRLYLRMRIIIDPSYPGGYKADSPFDFAGKDNSYFLRQIQWLEQSETVFLGSEPIQDFLNKEICKLCPAYKTSAMDFQVFLIERMPLLKYYRSKVPYIYEDMERIYGLIQRQNSLLEKENIVNSLSRSVVESLFNIFFKTIGQSKLELIQQRALDELETYGYIAYKKKICSNVHLNEDTLRTISMRYLSSIINKMNHTYGNSIMEKFINMIIIEYHLSDVQMHRFLFQPDVYQKYQLIDRLNSIRRKVSHDTDIRFSNSDYEYYMTHVYELINSLLIAFRED